PIARYLAGAGIGKLGCMDFDRVEVHNLHRQVAHTEHTIGLAKVHSLQKQIGQLNSDIVVEPIEEKVSSENIEQYISSYDVIVDGGVTAEPRYVVNDACAKLRRTRVYGTVLNFETQMAGFNYQGS